MILWSLHRGTALERTSGTALMQGCLLDGGGGADGSTAATTAGAAASASAGRVGGEGESLALTPIVSACECGTDRLLALAFGGVSSVGFVRLECAWDASKGSIQPLPKLRLDLETPPLELGCCAKGKTSYSLVIVTAKELLIYVCGGEGGVEGGAIAGGRLLLSALPVNTLVAEPGETAGDSDKGEDEEG